MEVCGKRSDIVSESCELCLIEGLSTQADGYCNACDEHMCNKCFQHHVKAKSCRSHVLSSLGQSVLHSKKQTESIEKCKKHVREYVKYYCGKHDMVTCGDCIVGDHHGCKLEFRSNLANQFENSSEFKDIIRKIEKLEAEQKENKAQLDSNRKETKSCLDTALGEIKKFRKDINDHLDKVETEIIFEANKMAKQNDDIIDQVEKMLSVAEQDIGDIRNNLDANMIQGDTLFIRTKSYIPKLNKVDEHISLIRSKNVIRGFTFEQEKQLADMVTFGVTLGCFKSDNSTEKEPAVIQKTKQPTEPVKLSMTSVTDDKQVKAKQSYLLTETKIGHTQTLLETRTRDTQTAIPFKTELATEYLKFHEETDSYRIQTEGQCHRSMTALGQTQTVPVESHHLATALEVVRQLPETLRVLQKWITSLEVKDGSRTFTRQTLDFINTEIKLDTIHVSSDNSITLSRKTVDTILQHSQEYLKFHEESDSYTESQRREAERVQREIAAQRALREKELQEMLHTQKNEKREREAEQAREQLKLKNHEEALTALKAKQRAALERKLKEPWRTFESRKGIHGDWTRTYHDHLIEQIKRHTHHGYFKDAQVLFLGPIRAGKSSFINSVATIDKGRIAYPLLTGYAAKSMSRKLRVYRAKNILQDFRLLDTMGVEEAEGEGFNVQDVIYVINGNVKPDYKFDPKPPIDITDEVYFKKNPTLKDKCHCIVVVMDSLEMYSDSISDETKKKLRALQDHVRDCDVPTVLILTKIDELCEEVHDDIKITYHSRKVGEVVRQASEMFGVQMMDIFPVKNYSSEQEFDTEMNILILLALRKMMEYCSDRLKSLEEQQESESENSD